MELLCVSFKMLHQAKIWRRNISIFSILFRFPSADKNKESQINFLEREISFSIDIRGALTRRQPLNVFIFLLEYFDDVLLWRQHSLPRFIDDVRVFAFVFEWHKSSNDYLFYFLLLLLDGSKRMSVCVKMSIVFG